ncbi:hypothetical protein Q4R50_20230, partial [Morganella morganii]
SVAAYWNHPEDVLDMVETKKATQCAAMNLTPLSGNHGRDNTAPNLVTRVRNTLGFGFLGRCQHQVIICIYF